MIAKPCHEMSDSELDSAINEVAALVPKLPLGTDRRDLVMSYHLMLYLERDRRIVEQARLRGQAKRERPVLSLVEGGRR